jgi:hypothetical protein
MGRCFDKKVMHHHRMTGELGMNRAFGFLCENNKDSFLSTIFRANLSSNLVNLMFWCRSTPSAQF